jgi:Protein of unknown function (DUF4239)
MELLQSSALPLGYVAGWSGRRESNPRINLGKVAGYHYITPAQGRRRARFASGEAASYNLTNVGFVTWIYYIPTWLFAPLAVAGCVALAIAGLNLARSTYRNDAITHNDVAAPILTFIGGVLAVMLSFLVVAVWQQFDDSAAGVQKEATSALNLYRMAPYLPGGAGPQIRTLIRQSLKTSIEREWPAMRHGSWSAQLSAINDGLLQLVATSANRTNTSIGQETLDDARDLIDARRARLHDNETGIPMFMWAVMIFIAAVTVVFSYYLRIENVHAHQLMVAAITAIIAVMFVLIAELDYPFRGDINVAPTALEHSIPTPRAAIIAIVTSDVNDSSIISVFARSVSGNVSVGLNAVALVKAR